MMSTPVLKILPCVRGVLIKCNPRQIGASSVSLRNYWRRNVFSELSSTVQSMENRIRDMDREINRMFDEVQKASPVKLPRIFSVLENSRTREIPVVSTSGDGRTYRIQLDVQGMQPEDINVTLKDQELTVVARVDESRSDGSRVVRENKYHYTLPKEVNPDTIRSSLSDGILTIEAPLPALESKEIPVKIETSGSDGDTKKE